MAKYRKEDIDAIGNVLRSYNRPMKERFRALFTLKNLGGQDSIQCIAKCFDDPSALLKHELAYCLGQMQNIEAVDILVSVLRDTTQDPMVRHEAGEALGALGSPELIEVLEEYSSDPVIEVAETCQIAVMRLKWLKDSRDNGDLSINPYGSVDPAPPTSYEDISLLKKQLLDESLTLFERYRAMFSLRNIGTKNAVLALTEGFKACSALFRHEIAFVLGQLQDQASVPALVEVLQDLREHEMVRHECAEALGSIATSECIQVLQQFLLDEKQVVRESCEVALDMCDYETNCEFQYANLLQT